MWEKRIENFKLYSLLSSSSVSILALLWFLYRFFFLGFFSTYFESVMFKGKDKPDSELDLWQYSEEASWFKCLECGCIQLTREIPGDHAEDSDLGFPESADRDMVSED